MLNQQIEALHFYYITLAVQAIFLNALQRIQLQLERTERVEDR